MSDGEYLSWLDEAVRIEGEITRVRPPQTVPIPSGGTLPDLNVSVDAEAKIRALYVEMGEAILKECAARRAAGATIPHGREEYGRQLVEAYGR